MTNRHDRPIPLRDDGHSTPQRLFDGGRRQSRRRASRRHSILDYGIPMTIKIGPNHLRSTNITPLRREDLENACERLGDAAYTLGRPVPKSPIACELLLHYYFVVKEADSIFAFWYLSSSQKQVQGGTGWVVQIAVDLNKHVFVYDVNFHHWYEWNKATGFTLMTSRFPILAPRSAIIGSKAFPSKAQDAMKKLFELTEQAQAREVT